jgi:glyoxylase I family protein
MSIGTRSDAASKIDASDIPLKQLSHSATRVRDMRATRRFYEEFLGLPMVTTMVADFDVVTKAPSNYVHCFFQLSDGSAIAFFQFEKGYRDEVLPHTSDPYERHMALRVDTKDKVDEFSVKASRLGIANFIVDHDDFYSLYLTDPDADIVEVTWHKPSFDALIDRDTAAKALERWFKSAQA